MFLNTRRLKNLHRLKNITELIRQFNWTLFQQNIMEMRLFSTNRNYDLKLSMLCFNEKMGHVVYTLRQ